jgi:hypothetical protein
LINKGEGIEKEFPEDAAFYNNFGQLVLEDTTNIDKIENPICFLDCSCPEDSTVWTGTNRW